MCNKAIFYTNRPLVLTKIFVPISAFDENVCVRMKGISKHDFSFKYLYFVIFLAFKRNTIRVRFIEAYVSFSNFSALS